MNPLVGMISVVALGFIVSMTVIVPSALGPLATTVPEDMAFASPLEGGAANFTQSVCPCFEGIPDFATNERQISNEFFAQNQSYPDPQGLSTWAWAWGQVFSLLLNTISLSHIKSLSTMIS